MTTPRLLIIDDDADITTLVRRIAENQGYAVTTTLNYGDFIRAYGTDVSVVVVDLLMPDVDGIEIMRYLAEQASQARVIITSGVDSKVLRTAANLALGRGLHVSGALSKPFKPDALKALLIEDGAVAVGDEMGDKIRVTVADLRRGIDADELLLFYQPKADIATREIVGVEALLRWQHPTMGIVPPSVFIPFAERRGLIGPLTELALERAFTQCAHWNTAGTHLNVSINLSALFLTSLNLPERIATLARTHAIDPDQITLEVTESWVSKDSLTALDILTRLRIKGFKLSMDDFGTGHSNVQQLREIPFTELKLDQSFVRTASQDPHSRAIIDSSIDLGHKLSLLVVAEGVESESEWDLVSSIGCDQVQGHYVARPVRGAQVPEMMTRWRERIAIT